jgi:hypothetical protein
MPMSPPRPPRLPRSKARCPRSCASAGPIWRRCRSCGLAPGSPIEKLPGLDDFALPGDLPLAMPADLLTTRPDVAGRPPRSKGRLPT